MSYEQKQKIIGKKENKKSGKIGKESTRLFQQNSVTLHHQTYRNREEQSVKCMKRLLLFLLTAFIVQSVGAQIRGNNIVVTVEPDHQDWNYRIGETAKFTIEVRRSGTLMGDVSIDYAVGPEMYQDEKKTITLKDGTLKLNGKMDQPGFYRVDVTAHVDGKNYRGACAAAFSPEKLQPSTVMPSDFKTFWENSIKEARYTDLEPTKRLLPERCTKDVNVYEESFNSVRVGARTFGILGIPPKEGN